MNLFCQLGFHKWDGDKCSKCGKENNTLEVEDLEGDTYETVKIGDQVWMARNLNVSRFRNGNPIPIVKSNDEWTRAGDESKAASCFYNNEQKNGKKYGRLYNWYAIYDKRGVAPEGWHIPSNEEYQKLALGVGKNSNALKAIGQGTGTNRSGFTALLGGYREHAYVGNKDFFRYIKESGFFWTSTWHNAYESRCIYLSCNSKDIYFVHSFKGAGLSIRCIKD